MDCHPTKSDMESSADHVRKRRCAFSSVYTRLLFALADAAGAGAFVVVALAIIALTEDELTGTAAALGQIREEQGKAGYDYRMLDRTELAVRWSGSRPLATS